MPDDPLAIRIPVDNGTLTSLEVFLQRADVFTSGFSQGGPSVYCAATYLRESIQHHVATAFLLDRNILTRLASLRRGTAATPPHRVAAGVMAFAQITNALVEPNIALYELAIDGQQEASRNELAATRQLDNSHPQMLADLALGRTDLLDPKDISSESGPRSTDVDFRMPPRTWHASQIALLKIAVLELTVSDPVSKMRQLIEWMHTDFVYIRPALHFASLYFAPNQPSRGLLKQLRSPDRPRALAGIKNAAWDLALVYQWSQTLDNQARTRRLPILASADKGLHRIARAMLIPSNASDPNENVTRGAFQDLWGLDRGSQIAELYCERASQRRRGDGYRHTFSSDEVTSIRDSLITEILDWR